MDRLLIPIGTIFDDLLPGEWLVALHGALAKVALDASESRTEWDRFGFYARCRLVILQRARFDLPLVPGMVVSLGDEGSYPSFVVRVRTSPFVEVFIEDLSATLWLPAMALRPYQDDGGWRPVPGPDGFPLVWTAGLRANLEGNIDIPYPKDRAATIAVPHAGMIADTGFILDFGGEDGSAGEIRFVFGAVPFAIADRVPAGFRGLYIPSLTIHYHNSRSPGTRLPEIGIEHAALGSGGFTGWVAVGDPAPLPGEDLEERLDAVVSSVSGAVIRTFPRDAGNGRQVIVGRIEDFKIVAYSLAVEFHQSLPTASSLLGYAYFPFTERWLEFRIALGGPDGTFMLALEGVGDEALISLENDWFEIKADSIEYFTRDGVHYAAVSGSIRPKFEGIDWPEFRVEQLMISSEGDIEIDGGWIDAPEAVTLDFHGFKVDISQIGLGKEGEGEDKSQWIGFTGSISLVQGIPLTASVEGLTVTWFPNTPAKRPEFTLKGLGVHLEIPGVLILDGSVSYEEVTGDDEHKLSGHLFKGHVRLALQALKVDISGELMIGRVHAAGRAVTVFYIFADVDLPKPIPLASSGAAIYRLSGLFGMHAAPDRDEEPWYEWYKAGSEEEGTAYNATTVKKWGPEFDNYAFGAGLMVGTLFDNGWSLNVNAMVIVLIPGPVVMIEGKANVLRRGPNVPEAEGAFYALLVIDARADTLQFNVDLNFELRRIIEVSGGIDAFFDFNNASAWYLHLGKKEPESERIQAKILSLFTSQAYLMIDNRSVLTGSKSGYDLEKRFGPVRLKLVALIAYDAGIFWKPVQVEGRLDLQGGITLKVFGIGFELLLQLLLEAHAVKPFWIHGLALIKLGLPWPLPDIQVKLEFTWGKKERPDFVDPFLKGAAMIHHKLPDSGWPAFLLNIDELRRLPGIDRLLAPGLALDTLSPQLLEQLDRDPKIHIPVVPVDSRAVLSFARPLHNRSGTLSEGGGIDLFPPDRVDDSDLSYYCNSVELAEAVDNRFELLKVHSDTSLPGDTSNVTAFDYGQDSLFPGPDAQEPQWQLWKHAPLDAATLRWRESYTDAYPACQPQPEPHCIDWDDIADGTPYPYEFSYQGLEFVADLKVVSERRRVPTLPPKVEDSGLRCYGLTVRFPEPVGWLELEMGSPGRSEPVEVKLFRRGELVGGGETGR